MTSLVWVREKKKKKKSAKELRYAKTGKSKTAKIRGRPSLKQAKKE